MTPAEFKIKMEEMFPQDGYDPEAAHSHADRVMCDLLRRLGYGDGVDVFEAADRWYA